PLVGFVADERIEWALLIAVILVGVASLLPGLLFRHRDAKPLILFVVGIALLFAARLLSEEEATLELVAIVASATLIAS
ncbi:MerC family mercury resistance protein, partial [Escherichia coli]|nr:MerC family mercury resistance protein [Escherichia coli]